MADIECSRMIVRSLNKMKKRDVLYCREVFPKVSEGSCDCHHKEALRAKSDRDIWAVHNYTSREETHLPLQFKNNNIHEQQWSEYYITVRKGQFTFPLNF